MKSLPERELTRQEVESIGEHDKIDGVEVELTSTGTSHADGAFRREMVEAWWLDIGGTAYVFQYQFQEWRKIGEFETDGLEEGELHRTAFEFVDY